MTLLLSYHITGTLILICEGGESIFGRSAEEVSGEQIQQSAMGKNDSPLKEDVDQILHVETGKNFACRNR